MAQVKHLAAYNGAQNVVVDERTLHEIYLPAFEAAARAGVASAMCAYNKVNGEWACENGELQNGVLRGLLGFQGFITSDWGAVHGPIAIMQGLDLEMPGREIGGRRGAPYFTDALKNAVDTGAIPVAAVDRAVTRILTQMQRFGWLDRKQSHRRTIDVEADARIVRAIAGRKRSPVKERYRRVTAASRRSQFAGPDRSHSGPTCGRLPGRASLWL